MKNLSKLGKALSKVEQKSVKGGILPFSPSECICVFKGNQGFLVLEDISCNQQSVCESRPNGRFFSF